MNVCVFPSAPLYSTQGISLPFRIGGRIADLHARDKMRAMNSTGFSAHQQGSAGACEAQLWSFTGPQKISEEDNTPETVWIAAESLDEALQYVRQRHDDLIITAARLAGMVALLSGSPLD